MDTALKNGDFSTGSNGRPKQIGGILELLQRAMIHLNVPLGGFVYDTSLGSRLYTLETDDTDFTAKAVAMAQEALLPVPMVTVTGVTCPEPKTALVQVECRGENAEIEVNLSCTAMTKL